MSALVTVCCKRDLNFEFCIDKSIVLRDNELNDYETDVDCDSQCVESAESNSVLFSSSEITFNFRTSVFSSFEECYNIETAQHLQLSKQDAAMFNLMQPHGFFLCSLSKLLHDCIDAEDHFTNCARFEFTTFHLASSCNQSLHCFRLSSLNQLSQKNNLHINQSAVNKHKQAHLSLNTHAFYENRQ